MRRAPLFLFACVLAGTGCYSSARAPGEPTPAPTDDLACDPAELASAWAARDGDDFAGVYHPVALQVAPGGALFLRSGYFRSEIARMADGSSVGPLEGATVALDASWTRSLETDHETGVTTVRALAAGDLLRTIEALEIEEGWSAVRRGALSSDGTTAILLECAQSRSSEETRTTVRAITIATGHEVRANVDLACREAWGNPSGIHPVAGGAVVISGLRAPGPSFDGSEPVPVLGLARVDLATGATITAFPSDDTTRPAIRGTAHIGEPGADIISIAVPEDGTELAIVSRDGMLRRLDAATLAPIAAAIEVPLFVANHDTYLPSVESPVAYSSEHAWIAHLGDGGEIVIRDTITGDVRARLELPFARREDGEIAPAMSIRFVDDGLLVTTSQAMARFGCGGAIGEIVRPSGELGVRVAGPTSARVGERTTYDVTVENATLPVVRTVRVGPTGGRAGSLGPSVVVYPYESGMIDVEVVADDGVRAARTTMRLDVLATE